MSIVGLMNIANQPSRYACPDETRPMTRIAALIVAGGRGERAETNGPKQYIPLAGKALLAHTLSPFLAHHLIDVVRVVIHADDHERYAEAISSIGSHSKLLDVAIGGCDRQSSVRNGLESLSNARPSLVMIHDAARPFVTSDMITRVIDKIKSSAAVILGTQLTDTLKRCTTDNFVSETIPRRGLWRAETPQIFRYEHIVGAHRRAAQEGRSNFTDDASLAEWSGIPVAVVESGGANDKITYPQDVAMAEQRFTEKPIRDIRTGQGFDVHKFKTGDHVWLCGVKIPHDFGVDAHSDGDVGLHALTDALLGAIADGDIGVHFKNTDKKWKDAASDLFVSDAKSRILNAGGTISNVDVTILCEAPKITKYRAEMRQRIAEIVGIDASRVSVKATTTESLGFTGRKEGLAALASATVIFR
jgi:2-C-methyl-D-erythritol 4-phosphate cytidylyltransferase / 2-C-methyl-D-erythritol 2,4-cyclodiphosphate synthase